MQAVPSVFDPRAKDDCHRARKSLIVHIGQRPIGALYERNLCFNGLVVGRSVLHARLDFFLDGLAIEVKIDGSLSALTRQVHRYAQHSAVTGIIVVTSLPRLKHLPDAINGKPVRFVVVYHP